MNQLNDLPCPVLITDSHGAITDANSGLLKLVGCDKKDWLGKPMESLFSTPSRILLQTHLWPMLLHDGHLEEVKLEVVDTNKSRSPVLVNCQRSNFEGVESFLWVLFVSRERSRFELALLEARDRAEASMKVVEERECALAGLSAQLLATQEKVSMANESGGVGIWDLNLQTGELIWDDLMYRLYGLEPHSQSNAYDLWASHLHADDKKSAEAAFQHSLLTGEDFFNEFRIVWPDGTVRHLRGFGRLHIDESGVVVRIVGTNIDVTETHLQSQALQDALDKAEAASQSKGQFLANMSHEIRTPMNAILGLLNLLQSTELTARQSDYASKTERAAQSLLGLLNDILDFSKVEAGKMTMESLPFRFDKLLRDLSVVLSANVGHKDIEVLFDIDPTLPSIVCGDVMRLQQILINLGGNAIKFTSSGQVLLCMRKLAESDNSVTVEFAVQDTGIGIAKEHQGHIFSGFSQAEGSTTRRFGGTGLGLAISKKFVELMGGDIQITSEKDVGSTFAFTLSMPKVIADHDTLNEPQSLVPLPKRALVVDDNPVAGELSLRMVRSLGWTADLAKSGKQAVEMVSAHPDLRSGEFPYPVIYMDWQMADMDGWEATRQIRALAQQHSLNQPKVIMVAACGRDMLSKRTDKEQSLINGFLVKPSTASMLCEAWMDAQSGKSSLRKLTAGRSSNRQLQGMRILVVEDNLINQQVADELLSAEGATVVLAANGQLGVEAVAAAAPQFDVVLMDVQMPVLDGYGATRAIREDLRLKEIPIVAMTANAMASDRDACLAAGMNEHIGKPFDLAKLVSLLIRITGIQASPAEVTSEKETLVHSGPIPEITGLDIQTALNRMSGLRSLYVRTARDFVKILESIIPKFQLCLKNGDNQQAQMLLHTLKGNAGTLGAIDLAARAAAMEKLCTTEAGMKECESELTQFEMVVRSTRGKMLEAITSLEAGSVPTLAVSGKANSITFPKAAIDAVMMIMALAKASDLRALEEFARVRTLIVGFPVELLDALELALQDLDLDAATAACDRILLHVNEKAV